MLAAGRESVQWLGSYGENRSMSAATFCANGIARAHVPLGVLWPAFVIFGGFLCPKTLPFSRPAGQVSRIGRISGIIGQAGRLQSKRFVVLG